MPFEHKTNRGSLFRNTDKQDDADRDYKGVANIEGRLFWVSGWVQQSEGKLKFLSLSFKPQNADTAQPKKSVSEDFNDSIGF
jgi:hypothetical protein